MGAVLVLVADVFREQPFQMTSIHRDDIVQQVSSAAFDPIDVAFARMLAHSESIKGMERVGIKRLLSNLDVAVGSSDVRTPIESWLREVAHAMDDRMQSEPRSVCITWQQAWRVERMARKTQLREIRVRSGSRFR
jgi:hypothetical protein